MIDDSETIIEIPPPSREELDRMESREAPEEPPPTPAPDLGIEEGPGAHDTRGASAESGGIEPTSDGRSYNLPTKSHLARTRAPHDSESTTGEDQRAPVPGPARAPRCVVSPTIDGYTRCRLTEWAAPSASSRMVNLIARLREPLTIEQERDYRRAGGRRVWLPVDHPVPTDPDGPRRVMAQVVVTGARGQTITLHVEKHIFVRLQIEAGIIDVQFKAGALWALGAGTEGFRVSASYWLRQLSLLFLDAGARETIKMSESILDPHPKGVSSIARVLGWKMTGVEICADFEGLDFRREDARSFIGIKQTGNLDGEADGTPKTEVFGTDSENAETITVGNRASPVSVCVYDKTLQVEKSKGGDRSHYEAAWRKGGWDGEASIRRVEMRITGLGLTIEQAVKSPYATGEVVDLRDPAKVADPIAMATAWAWVTASKRLIHRSSATRPTRCKTDERWFLVQHATETDDLGDMELWRQRRTVQEDAHEVAVERARRGALVHLARFTALHGRRADASDLQAAANCTGEVQREAANRVEDFVTASMFEALSIAIEGENLVDLGKYQYTYGGEREAFMGPEIRNAAAVWDARLGKWTRREKRREEAEARRELEAVAE